MPKRKYFGRVKATIYGGREENTTLGLRFDKIRLDEAKKLVDNLSKAIEYGMDIDITIHKGHLLQNGKVPITITAPSRD